jgi:hypothetical protein
MVLSTYIIVEWIKTLLENFAKCKYLPYQKRRGEADR